MGSSKRNAGLLVMVLLLISACTKEKPATVVKTDGPMMDVATKVIGIGFDADRATTDSYSTYYAVQNGVRYQYDNGMVKLRLDYSNTAATVSVETLASAQVVKIANGFTIIEYPYNGKIKLLTRDVRKISSSINVSKPFSYLSRLIVKAIINEYGGTEGTRKGKINLIQMDYQKTPTNDIIISADFILAETKEDARHE